LGSVAVGIDYGNQYVKFATLRRRGQQLVIERLVKVPRSVSETGQQIGDGLRLAGLKASKGVLGVSGRGAIIRYTTVPPVPVHRLKIIMDYEIGELAGKSAEAVSSDYKVLNIAREASEDFTVMVAMSKDQYVKESMDSLRKAGMGVADILPTPLAVYNTAIGLGLYEEDKTMLVVDIGATNVDIAIMKGRDLLFARSIGRGADDFTESVSEALGVGFPEAERIKVSQGYIANSGWRTEEEKQISDALSGAADRLHGMLNSSLGFAAKQLKIKDIKPDHVILVGGGSNLPGLSEHIARMFETEVIMPDFLQTFRNAGGQIGQFHLAESIPPGDFSGASPELREFSTAIGLAVSRLDASFYSMNLIPAEEKKKRIFKEQTVYLYVAGAILLLFLMVRLAAAWREQGVAVEREVKLDERLEEAGQRLFELRKITKENAQITSAIQRLSKVTGKGAFLTELLFLTRDKNVTPSEILITEMQLKETVSSEETQIVPAAVIIRGQVDSQTGNEYDIVRRFRDRLVETDLVMTAKIDPSRTAENRGEFRFEMLVSVGRAK